jgi:glutamate--cysteine ligase catalytic subunit
MLESTPGAPFTGLASDLVKVEADMRFRRKIIRSYLKPNEVPMTMTSWPRLGVDGGGFTEPETFPSAESSSKSRYVAQEITNPHARFPYVLFSIHCGQVGLGMGCGCVSVEVGAEAVAEVALMAIERIATQPLLNVGKKWVTRRKNYCRDRSLSCINWDQVRRGGTCTEWH